MPVQKKIGTPPRQIVFLIISTVLGIGSMVYVFNQISSDTIQNQSQSDLGAGVFQLGDAATTALEIGESGPFLFGDLSGNDRDVIIQHVGDDPLQGWVAIAARPSSSARECSVEWQPESREFVDQCDGTSYDETGEGLPNYPLIVNSEGKLLLDLG